MLTAAIPTQQPPKLVDGSMESLKKMARNRQFKSAIIDTLPFETLKQEGQEEMTPEERRSRRCAECMATVLKLVGGVFEWIGSFDSSLMDHFKSLCSYLTPIIQQRHDRDSN